MKRSFFLYVYVAYCSEDVWAEVFTNHWTEFNVALLVLLWVLVSLKITRVIDR